MRARKCAEVSRRARRISRKVFRRPFGTLCVCRSLACAGPILVVSVRFGSRSVVTPGVGARGWGGTRTSSRTRPPSAEPPSWRPFCSSGGVRGRGGSVARQGERPENGQRVEKSGESVRGGTHLGPQRPPSGAHAEKRDMLAMSVKLAGSGARVHVRRVSRARANARMRVMTHPPTPRTIFFFGKTVVGHVARAFFRTLPLFRARGGRHGGRHGGPRPSRVRRVRGRRLRDPHGQDRTRAAVSYMHGCVRRRDGHAMRPLLLRHVHHVQHPAQKAVSAV